jgi:hypothetical protein
MSKLTVVVGALCLAAVAAGGARAQNPSQPASPPASAGGAGDSGMMPMRWQGRGMARAGGPMMNQQRRQQLMTMIQQRFAERVQSRLGLSNQQMDQLRTVMQQGRDQRQHLAEQEQDLRRAIGEQLRPGVAANQDSLSRLLDAVAANHVARAQLEQQELHQLSFLTPVQRAQLLLMRQMLMQRVQAIREGGVRAPGGRQGFGVRPGGPGAAGGAGPDMNGPGPQ